MGDVQAKIGHRTPKDLRDTYASQLITAGVQLGYVSHQLGDGSSRIEISSCETATSDITYW
jgi:integrase